MRGIVLYCIINTGQAAQLIRPGNAAFFVEALVVMSTRFLKDHIEIKWWIDGYYHHRELIYARGTCTQSWSQFSRFGVREQVT